MLGDMAFEVALAWLVLEETGSVAALAGVMLVPAVPRAGLLLFGGAVTDRLSPATVMFAAHAVRAVVVATIAALAASGDFILWQLYVLAGVTGVAGAFFEPVSIALLGAVLHWSLAWGFAAVPMLLVGTRMVLDPRSRELSAAR